MSENSFHSVRSFGSPADTLCDGNPAYQMAVTNSASPMLRSRPLSNQFDLTQLVTRWNQTRLEIFQLTKLEGGANRFSGIIRFFFQDVHALSNNHISMKCVRLTSDTTVSELLPILIEKFMPNYDDNLKAKADDYCLCLLDDQGQQHTLDKAARPLLLQLGHVEKEARFLLQHKTECHGGSNGAPANHGISPTAAHSIKIFSQDGTGYDLARSGQNAQQIASAWDGDLCVVSVSVKASEGVCAEDIMSPSLSPQSIIAASSKDELVKAYHKRFVDYERCKAVIYIQ